MATPRRRRGRLTPLHEYRAEVLRRIQPLEPLELALLEALGCVLAEDVVAPSPVPRVTRSGVDGFAVQAESLEPDEPMTVIGQATAGQAAEVEVAAGHAVRVASGAPVPSG